MSLFYPSNNYKRDNNVCKFMLLAFSEFLKGVATEEDDAGDTYYVTATMKALWQGTDEAGPTALTKPQRIELLQSITNYKKTPVPGWDATANGASSPPRASRRANTNHDDDDKLYYVLKQARMFKAAADEVTEANQAIQDQSRPEEYNLALLPYNLKNPNDSMSRRVGGMYS